MRKNKKDKSIEKSTAILLGFSKKIVIFCLSFVTLYTVVAIVFQSMRGEVLSDVLTERVFTCLIGELCITGLLKVAENVVKAFGRNGADVSDIVDNIENTICNVTNNYDNYENNDIEQTEECCEDDEDAVG